MRGPSITPIHEERTSVDNYRRMTTWTALLTELRPSASPPGLPRSEGWCKIVPHDVPLARRCQIFLDVWDYGSEGPFAIRGRAGALAARRTYCEIIRPFKFELEIPFIPGDIRTLRSYAAVTDERRDR
jgi:hypothetical protein